METKCENDSFIAGANKKKDHQFVGGRRAKIFFLNNFGNRCNKKFALVLRSVRKDYYIG